MVANTPWSGQWFAPDAVWMVAHTTQFVQPGWRFAGSGGCTMLAGGNGSVVSYVSPDGKDLSIVIIITEVTIERSTIEEQQR